MTKADELKALADRVEREEPSEALDCAVGAAAFPEMLGISDGFWGVRLADAFAQYAVEDPEYLGTVAVAFDLPAYTTSLDAAVALEPKDAQEIVVRKYPAGGFSVRITPATGTPVYSETFHSRITEAGARTAAALRARASLTQTQGGE